METDMNYKLMLKLMMMGFLAGVLASSVACRAKYEFTKKKNDGNSQNFGPNQTPNGAPTAAPSGFTIAANPPQGVVGQPIGLIAAGCGPNNEGQVTWQFGDGQIGIGLTINHTYTVAGTYKIDATCTKPDQTVVNVSLNVYIEATTGNTNGTPVQKPNQTPNQN